MKRKNPAIVGIFRVFLYFFLNNRKFTGNISCILLEIVIRPSDPLFPKLSKDFDVKFLVN